MNRKFWIIAAIALFGYVSVAFLLKADPQDNDNNLTVFAASSFAWVLHENEELIEAKTGLEIIIAEAASSTLALQIKEGAPADVFVTADKVWLEYLDDRQLLHGDPLEFAQNRLVFALSPGVAGYCNVQFFAPPNADHLLGVCPFSGTVATGDPAFVPLGKYALEAVTHFEWDLNLIPASNARAALALLETGATDAGILYQTDVIAAGNSWPTYEIPETSHQPIQYWATLLAGSDTEKAKKFLDFLKSEGFKTILKSKGFELD